MKMSVFISSGLFSDLFYKQPLFSRSIFLTVFIGLLAISSALAEFLEDGEAASMEGAKSFFLKKEYSLSKPYHGSWDFGGTTLITSEYVRMTSDTASQSGSVWCTTPVTMRNWEAHLHFRVHGSASNLFGDGFAFWYVDPSNRFAGPVFGNQDQFRGLGVFFDTYSNHNGPHSHDHPYISAMVSNGSHSYDHDRDGTHSQLAGCTAKFRNRDHDTLAAISYVDNVLTVSTDIDNKGMWQRCLRVTNVRLPTHFIFGASAMTGDLSDNHDLLSIKIYEVDYPKRSSDIRDLTTDYRNIEPSAEASEPEREHVDQPVPSRWNGFRIFLLILFSLIGIAAVIVGLYFYYTKQEENRKRFY
ncbi:hypothetical protein BOX15_Mlig011218g1 [Macrostomum lignano]|uniref:L-type lectin-like domain-containing protein n=2 Tax=Macrostomum lignano TaxID=282301 RepID=A0A267ESU2_9PLAT|nr:hypothetical protein BOX15_Mlig011218g1 [Macrostomum lignano]